MQQIPLATYPEILIPSTPSLSSNIQQKQDKLLLNIDSPSITKYQQGCVDSPDPPSKYISSPSIQISHSSIPSPSIKSCVNSGIELSKINK